MSEKPDVRGSPAGIFRRASIAKLICHRLDDAAGLHSDSFDGVGK